MKKDRPLGYGSGFFINAKGHIITNYHVLGGAARAKVKTADDKIYPVIRILAEDHPTDLIMAAVAANTETPFLPLSKTVPEVGERVVVIGSPKGLEWTVADGVVSALRDITQGRWRGKFVQTSAPISPGSSGSPVLDMKGEVIGVATFFIVAGQNLNFAIPGTRITGLTPGRGQALSEREEAKMEEWLASPQGLYLTGFRLLVAENYEKALPYFLETVKRNPRHADAFFQMGYCLRNLGNYPGAISAYEQAFRIKPEDPEIPSNLCVVYGMVGRFSDAVESCNTALRLKPDLAEAYSNLGWALHRLGQDQEAIEASKQAIRYNPDASAAHFNLGNAYAGKQRYLDAIEAYKHAIHLRFSYAEAHLNLGSAYFELKRYEQAIDSYKQAIRIKPAMADAHFALGMGYLRSGDRISAVEEYKIVKELDKELSIKLFNLIYE